MDERTFPGPWSFDEIPQGYRVLDANRRVIAYVVARDPSGIDRSEGLTREEAWRVARIISSLPKLAKETGTGRGNIVVEMAHTPFRLGATRGGCLQYVFYCILQSNHVVG
jgi:hypothetical protein